MLFLYSKCQHNHNSDMRRLLGPRARHEPHSRSLTPEQRAARFWSQEKERERALERAREQSTAHGVGSAIKLVKRRLV